MLYKGKGKVDDPNAYRGFALECALFKIMTKILTERLTDLTDYHIHFLYVFHIMKSYRHSFPEAFFVGFTCSVHLVILRVSYFVVSNDLQLLYISLFFSPYIQMFMKLLLTLSDRVIPAGITNFLTPRLL